ncbi:MAG: ECF transporter S component [Lachnospiraceae bacterium]|nr:ECF transporter S component [Lachnospiraceae bacterium]MCR4597591.1 ECF transporter S component [Acetatifactor sp.]
MFDFATLWKNVSKNVTFVLEFLAIIVALFVIAVIIEKIQQKKSGKSGAFFTAHKMAVIGILSAMSSVLMLFEIPLFFAPSFYKLDFSEIPILLGSFAFGPAAGVVMEFIKILLKLVMKGTSTAFVGELANFAVGCSFIIPASTIYLFKKTKKTAILSCVIGTVILTVFGTMFNAVYLLPAFSKLFHMPMESILEMGSKVNPLMTEGSITSFVIVCVAPLNLLKGTLVSAVTIFIYKPLSRFLKGNGNK